MQIAWERLTTIPGVQRRTAEVIVAEIGLAPRRFPTAAHLASWAGMCPGNHESAGKRYSGKTRKGSKWLRSALVEAGNAAARTKDTALSARYRRVLRHRGHGKAVVAVGRHSLELSHLLLGTHAYLSRTRRRLFRPPASRGGRSTVVYGNSPAWAITLPSPSRPPDDGYFLSKLVANICPFIETRIRAADASPRGDTPPSGGVSL